MRKIRREIRELHQQLKTIMDEDRNERVTVFTDDRELQELAAQINRLLEDKAKTEADFLRSEMASRKMLSNISHDLKTPLTVIRGYLEILRTRGEAVLEARKGAQGQEEAQRREETQGQEEAQRQEETQGQEETQRQEETQGQTGAEMTADLQMLLKAEQKAAALMELIDSFFLWRSWRRATRRSHFLRWMSVKCAARASLSSMRC